MNKKAVQTVSELGSDRLVTGSFCFVYYMLFIMIFMLPKLIPPSELCLVLLLGCPHVFLIKPQLTFLFDGDGRTGYMPRNRIENCARLQL